MKRIVRIAALLLVLLPGSAKAQWTFDIVSVEAYINDHKKQRSLLLARSTLEYSNKLLHEYSCKEVGGYKELNIDLDRYTRAFDVIDVMYQSLRTVLNVKNTYTSVSDRIGDYKSLLEDFNAKILKRGRIESADTLIISINARGLRAIAREGEQLYKLSLIHIFKDRTVSMTNFKADDETVSMGDKRCKVYSLVDVDCAALPSMIRPYTNIEVNNTEMPVDLASVVDNIPDAETVVYNQVIFLPNQKRELAMLDKKKNRHASIPNPNNQMAVEDIKRVQEVIARESKQLVYTHFNMVVAVSAGADLQKGTNHLENAFGRMGIHISKRAYNQLELFVGSFPGNCYTLNEEYDRFLTLSDAAMCLMYKERVLHSEETPLKIYYTDRQGVPVAIDITGKEGKNKLTDNSNFFCLGPSGSGKSFHINSVVRQLHEQGTDVVMVDTGNSYEGLCEYLGGKYISYTEERPITMNPFRINREEYNIEKIDFLKNLILMIWKGSDSQIPEIEFRIVEQIIIDYYDAYFNGFTRYTDEQREVLLKNLFAAASRKNPNKPPREVDEMVRKQIEVLEARRAALKVTELSFNSFFDYSFDRLEQICTENDITTISYSTYSTMLQPFYKGGAYEKILNETVDSALFDETFIVFEVDAIKENKKLFPIVTLIIMDVFLQKMRIKKNRKVLVIEEAWKAIASPLMAEYIKFMCAPVQAA